MSNALSSFVILASIVSFFSIRFLRMSEHKKFLLAMLCVFLLVSSFWTDPEIAWLILFPLVYPITSIVLGLAFLILFPKLLAWITEDRSTPSHS